MKASVSRRHFLQGATALSASGLVIGLTTSGSLAAMQDQMQDAALTPFIQISPAGQVTAIIKHFECGQGTATGLASLIAEEMNMSLDAVEVAFAPADASRYANLLFGSQGTGGSTSLANSFMQYRTAGAAARQMLLEAAAETWGMAADGLTLADGMITGGGRTAPVSDFVMTAAKRSVPAAPPLKPAADFTVIGNPATSRRDNSGKVTGTAPYAMDIQLDGQVVAVIKRSPRFGGKLTSFDAADAEQVAGFIRAAALPTGAGVVIYAKDTWSAFEARELLNAEWDDSAAETRSSDAIRDELLAAVSAPPEFTARGDLTVTQDRVQAAEKVIEHIFYFPYLAHAPMEPLTCTVEPTEDGVVLHDGCQSPSGAQAAFAAVLSIPAEKVQVNTLYAGGSFGRRATLTGDYHVEAALAFALDGAQRPVKLVWSREDDIHGGAYRPAVAHKVRVGLDKDGQIIGWDHRIAAKPIFKGSVLSQFMVTNGVDHGSVEGAHDTPYTLPGQFVGLTDIATPVTVNWWRSVGHSHTAYVMESMMDEVAAAAGQDPLAFRLAHLKGTGADQRRMRGVLELAAKKAGWGQPTSADVARGIAAHKSFGSYVAEVVETSRSADGQISIDKVTCAVDCGLPVNPDVITAQMESGIGYGIGHIMRDEITFTDGEVDQYNFPDYEPLRIGDISQIDVHIVSSAEAPSGVGEPGTPPAGPALANALAVYGQRVTMLPMTANGVDFG